MEPVFLGGTNIPIQCSTCGHSHARHGELTCFNKLSALQGRVQATDVCGLWRESCFT